MNKSLLIKIERFLSSRRKSSGGWAEVRVQDVNGLEAIIRELIKLKFEKDPDGDLPIEFKVIDRTWFEPMHFQPVPYLGIARCVDLTEDQKQDILDQHVLNLDIAHERFRNAHRILSHERRRKL